MRRFLALVLAAALLLCGCNYLGNRFRYPHADDLVYTRPDPARMEEALEEALDKTQTAQDVEDLMESVYAYYACYYDYSDSDSLAFLHYCHDTTDIYWQEETDYCSSLSAQVSADVDTLYRALAASSFLEELETEEYFGPGFFDAYQGESYWDETFISYMEQESQLVEEYYALYSAIDFQDPDSYDTIAAQIALIFRDLVALRQQIATASGYSTYPEFAYDYYYYRDYTPREAMDYFRQVQTKLASLYRRTDMTSLTGLYTTPCSEVETFGYLAEAATQMGGTVAEAFYLLSGNRLYDIAPGPNKYDACFEVYLDSYGVPFLYTCPWNAQIDKLYLAHEFGHFAADFACGGSVTGTDVAEVFSQAMEYLSLVYTDPDDLLLQGRLADCLCTYVEQSAYSLFEHQVYALPAQQLTPENIQALFAGICEDFGFDAYEWDPRDYVLLTHIFDSPMYMASYVFSNDVAFQLYQLESARPGAGLAIFLDSLTTDETFLRTFAQDQGLEDPFAPDRLEKVRLTLEPLFS